MRHVPNIETPCSALSITCSLEISKIYGDCFRLCNSKGSRKLEKLFCGNGIRMVIAGILVGRIVFLQLICLVLSGGNAEILPGMKLPKTGAAFHPSVPLEHKAEEYLDALDDWKYTESSKAVYRNDFTT